jgi:uncharacterized protein
MAANEKDRLGEKLHEVEKAREDIYFAERDRELMEKLRRSKEGLTEEAVKQATHMRCPKCGAQLRQRRLHDVDVDECPGCHGMWLDQGEAEKIGRRESEGWIARWLRSEFPKST